MNYKKPKIFSKIIYKNQNIIGILSKTDIIRYLINLINEILK